MSVLLLILLVAAGVAHSDLKKCSSSSRIGVIQAQYQAIPKCRRMDINKTMEQYTAFVQTKCNPSTCCSVIHSNNMECDVYFAVETTIKIDCSCAVRNVGRCKRQAVRIHKRMQEKTIIRLNFQVPKGKPKLKFNTSDIAITRPHCDPDDHPTNQPVTSTTAPPAICEKVIEGLDGNFNSSGEPCYTVCSSDPEMYHVLVFDQETLPGGQCSGNVAVAGGLCPANNQTTMLNCSQLTEPFLVVVENNCSCIQFTTPTDGSTIIKGRFASFGQHLLEFVSFLATLPETKDVAKMTDLWPILMEVLRDPTNPKAFTLAANPALQPLINKIPFKYLGALLG